jgi:hypothetical protein
MLNTPTLNDAIDVLLTDDAACAVRATGDLIRWGDNMNHHLVTPMSALIDVEVWDVYARGPLWGIA